MFGGNGERYYLCTRKTSSGFSAVGSAHVWGARGRWFESSNPDLTKGQLSKDDCPFCIFPTYVLGLRKVCGAYGLASL